MTLATFKAILTGISGVTVSHRKAAKAETDYIVWGEVGCINLFGDGAIIESGTRIAIDFFTKTEYSAKPALIVAALNAYDEISISDSAIDYEEDTRLTHYAYTVEVL